MGKAFIASLATLIVGVLGCVVFDALKCPEIGAVLAVAVMGGLIIMTIEDKNK